MSDTPCEGVASHFVPMYIYSDVIGNETYKYYCGLLDRRFVIIDPRQVMFIEINLLFLLLFIRQNFSKCDNNTDVYIYIYIPYFLIDEHSPLVILEQFRVMNRRRENKSILLYITLF